MPRIKRLLPFAAAAAVGAALAAALIALPEWDSVLGGDEARAAAPQPVNVTAAGGPTVTFHLPPIGSDGRLATVADCLRDQGVDLRGDTEIDVTEDGVTIDGDRVDEAKLRGLAAACWPAALQASGLDAGALGDLGDLGDLGSRLRELLEQLQGLGSGG